MAHLVFRENHILREFSTMNVSRFSSRRENGLFSLTQLVVNKWQDVMAWIIYEDNVGALYV